MRGVETGLDMHVLGWLAGAWSVCMETGTLGGDVDKGRKAGWPERGDGRVGILVGDVVNHRG